LRARYYGKFSCSTIRISETHRVFVAQASRELPRYSDVGEYGPTGPSYRPRCQCRGVGVRTARVQRSAAVLLVKDRAFWYICGSGKSFRGCCWLGILGWSLVRAKTRCLRSVPGLIKRSMPSGSTPVTGKHGNFAEVTVLSVRQLGGGTSCRMNQSCVGDMP